jgi:hypothetical protein
VLLGEEIPVPFYIIYIEINSRHLIYLKLLGFKKK